MVRKLWVCMQAGIFFRVQFFGFQVCGVDNESLMRHSVVGPDWISAGSFGPEVGIVVVPVSLIGLLVMCLWTAKGKYTLDKEIRQAA